MLWRTVADDMEERLREDSHLPTDAVGKVTVLLPECVCTDVSDR